MTDKEKFKAELDRLKEETYIGLSEHDNGVEQGRMEVINSLYKTLHHMQDEPLSEDFEEAANKYKSEQPLEDYRPALYKAFKAGAKWQERQMMAKAVDGIVRPDDGEIWFDFKLFDFEDSDKVKVIIIKDE